MLNTIEHSHSCIGLEIALADSSFLVHGRTRVQINEGVEIIVSIKNERNLASLTVYGDIEGQDTANTNPNSSSNEIYITAGVVRNLLFFLMQLIETLFRSIFRGEAKEQKKFNFVRIINVW